jgi:hypothetical protein
MCVSQRSLDKQERKGEARTNNIGIISLQDLVVLIQHFLQRAVTLGLGFLNQAPDRLHTLVVVSETGDEALEALVGGLVISRS